MKINEKTRKSTDLTDHLVAPVALPAMFFIINGGMPVLPFSESSNSWLDNASVYSMFLNLNRNA